MSACSFSPSSPPPAYALTISATSGSVQSDNLLRYDCSSTTDVSANSWMRFCEGSSCSPLSRVSTTSTGGTSHAMTIYNLKPSTTYTWQGVASLAGAAMGDSRGIAMDVDFTYLTTEILNEYSMGHVNDTGGSSFDMLPSGNVIATSPVGHEYTYFKEFDATNSVVWSMTMRCNPTTPCSRTGPSYRGIANPF